MMESKFDKLHKLIMENGFSDYREDPGNYFGKAAYSLNSVGEGNIELFGKRNGELILNPITGEPVKWEVVATHFNCYDAITRERIIAPHTVFELKQGSSRKNNLYVAIETYEEAYATDDIETIEKLKSIGLEPGFSFKTF